MFERRRAPAAALVGHAARRAAFVEHVDDVAGDDGMEVLNQQGADAYRVGRGLQGLARESTPAHLKAAKRVWRRHAVVLSLVGVVFLIATAFIGANAVASFKAHSERALVRSDGTVRVDGAVQRVDCWETGSEQQVWKAIAPFDGPVPYRCGDAPYAAVVPGPVSAGVFGVMVLSGGLLLFLRARFNRKESRFGRRK